MYSIIDVAMMHYPYLHNTSEQSERLNDDDDDDDDEHNDEP